MKYYSEVLKKFYDSEKEGAEAESARKELDDLKQARYDKIIMLLKEYEELGQKISDEIHDYGVDYGSFKYKAGDKTFSSFFDIFNW